MSIWQTGQLPPVYTPLRLSHAGRGLMAALRRGSLEPHRVAHALIEARYPLHRALLVDSGTSALRVALTIAARTIPTTERVVALPAYACPDIASAAIAEQWRVALYDIDAATLEPDIPSLRRCLSDGARAVVAAHLFGIVFDLQRVHDIARDAGAIVIEDAAQHASGAVNGVRGGSQAELAILSFGRGKGLNAGGGGAALIPRDLQIDAPMSSTVSDAVRASLMAVGTHLLSQRILFGIADRVPALGIGETVFHSAQAVREMTSVACTLLAPSLRDEASERAARVTRARYYAERLDGAPGVHTFAAASATSGGALRYPVRWPYEIAPALRHLGMVRSYPRRLDQYAEIAPHLVAPHQAYPGSAILAREIATLPTHRQVRREDQDRLVEQMLATTR